MKKIAAALLGIAAFSVLAADNETLKTYSSHGPTRAEACSKAKEQAQMLGTAAFGPVKKFSDCECSRNEKADPSVSLLNWYCTVDAVHSR